MSSPGAPDPSAEVARLSLRRVIDLSIQALIVLSMIAFALETLPNLDEAEQRALDRFELFTTVVFTAEYLTRLALAKHKLRFVFSFLGLVDLLAILPFYLSFGFDLRSLRAFRLLRLLRSVKLLRYSRALDRLIRAFTSVKEEMVMFMLISAFFIYLCAVGMYHFENEAQPEVFASVFHAVWWSVVTLTTVGYGDIYPVTVGGRIFTTLMVLIGLGIVAIPAGLMASAMSKTITEGEDAEPKA